MKILVYILPFAVLSPILIIGIKKFVDIFGYKKSNLEYTEAKLTKTDYASMYSRTRAAGSYTAYSYTKIGTYVFTVDDTEYEFKYSSDRDHGFLPDTITACYPKGKPKKAFAEGNTPFVRDFFNAITWILVYFIASSMVFAVAFHFFV